MEEEDKSEGEEKKKENNKNNGKLCSFCSCALCRVLLLLASDRVTFCCFMYAPCFRP